MEQEGIVSVWAGFFENEKALMTYAAEEGYDNEGNEKISPFNQDFSVVTLSGPLIRIFGSGVWLNPQQM